ncbi:MAG: DUF1016 domain-containing protein, partial [bacterium]|nr:DUF1016 domain-containing protein [bacterium]
MAQEQPRPATPSPPGNYAALLAAVRDRIRSAQYEALRSVNRELVALYWDVGRMIVGRQRGEAWGRAVVDRLAQDLRAELPGVRGFSASNLWRMRTFHLAYRGAPKLATLSREIGWSHNMAILERCKDDLEREFYLRMTRRMGWSHRLLVQQIENQSYEQTLLGQSNFAATLPEPLRDQARLAVKDAYTFDFLELGDEHSERQLEAAILGRVEPFLREMGGLFSFVGSQYRLEVAGREYFIDLLLFHRALRSLVAIELKIGEFQPEYVGKMQFYLAVLDDTMRLGEEQPAIGIILCKSKNETIVEY